MSLWAQYYLGYLLTRMEYKKQKNKQHVFDGKVTYQRSRGDSAGIRLEITIRVFCVFIKSQKHNTKCVNN